MSSSAPTEIACAVSWFSNWSREQRRTFLDRIKEKEEENSLEKATEGLLKELENLKLTKVRIVCTERPQRSISRVPA